MNDCFLILSEEAFRLMLSLLAQEGATGDKLMPRILMDSFKVMLTPLQVEYNFNQILHTFMVNHYVFWLVLNVRKNY